jgi:hypothetical protein
LASRKAPLIASHLKKPQISRPAATPQLSCVWESQHIQHWLIRGKLCRAASCGKPVEKVVESAAQVWFR